MSFFVVLHAGSTLIAIVAITVSVAIYLVLKERWRLYYAQLVAGLMLIVLCDGIGILLAGAGPDPDRVGVLVASYIAMCGLGAVFLPRVIRIHRYGMRFVFVRWERRYLLVFALPFACVAAGAAILLSFEEPVLFLVVLTCATATGAVISISSARSSHSEGSTQELLPFERQLAFMVGAIGPLLPLDIASYLVRVASADASWFPVRLHVTPAYLVTMSLLLTVSGFRAAAMSRGYGISPRIATSLTDREKEVSALLVDGLTHKEIGVKLFISRRTVDRHVENIYRKTGVKNKADFIRSVVVAR